jgi:uncharacterized protein (TIGR02147 family)
VNQAACQLLTEFFEKKKASRVTFSLRSFAAAMKVSPSFASAMLQGKKPIPLARLDQIAKILELDLLALNQLRRSLAQQVLKEHNISIDLEGPVVQKASKKYRSTPRSQFSILSSWYHVAILDLCTCAHFQKNNKWMAAQLGITPYQVEFALKRLLELGVLVETESGYKKVNSKIRLAYHESHSDIRRFHSQMIEKAQEELRSKTSIEDFQKREITGITIAANPKNVERARLKLIEALHEVAEILSEGETTDLYQINAQLFTLLKK